MPKEKGLYATELRAKPKKSANRNPVGTPSVGSFPSPTIPQKAGQIQGLGPISKPFGHPKVVHGYGHVARMKHGHLRLSGDTNAHRLGAPIGKLPKPKKY